MSRRARTENSVSLFPFLAVLVCVMGALILLLIVTTRRVRSDAIAKANQRPIPAPKNVEPLPPEPKPVVVYANPVLPSLPRKVITPATRHPLENFPKPQIDPNVELARRIAELEANERHNSNLSNNATRQRRRAEQNLSESQTLLASLRRKQKSANQQSVSLEKNKVQAQSLIARAATEKEQYASVIRKAKDDFARSSSEYAIIPFEGDSGTTRRPIYIECTGKAFRFLPENISLTAGDLRGFTPEYNPLKIGVKNLVTYWESQSRRNGERVAPKPYVLLLVRPSGNTSFYVARKLLSNLDIAIGYELIDEDWKLALPQTDSKAHTICKTGIDRAMVRRQQAVDSLVNKDVQPGSPRRSIRFHRGTGRLEVTEPDEKNSPGSGRTATRDPWREVLNSKNTTGRRMTGSPTPRNGTGNGNSAQNRTGNTGSNSNGFRAPRRLNQGTRRGTRNGSQRNGTFGIMGSAQANSTGRNGVSGLFDGGKTANSFPSTNPGSAFAKPGERGTGSKPSTTNSPFGKSLGTGQQPGSPFGRSKFGSQGNSQNSRGRTNGGRAATGSSSNSNFGQRTQIGATGTSSSSSSSATSGQPNTASSRTPTTVFGSRPRSRSSRPQKRRWGFSTPGSSIGFEREVIIQADANKLIVGKGLTIPVGKGETISALRRSVTVAIEQVARTWGKPPQSFYWVPRIRFVVGSGGNQHYQRLKGELHKLGLQSFVEYKKETPPVNRNRGVNR